MRVLLFLLIPLLAACSTMTPASSPSASVAAEPSEIDITGHWTGTWTGTGIFHSAREDTLTVDFVQRGKHGLGKLVLEGAVAAESVPEIVRFQGLNGIQVLAEIKDGNKVKLRHLRDGRLFTADLVVSEGGDRMFGRVRDSHPAVGLLLTRAVPTSAPVMPEPAPAPVVPAEPIQSQQEPEPATEPLVAMVTPQEAEPETATPAQRPSQEDFAAVEELKAVHFDFDKAVIRADAADTLVGYATWLKEHDDTAVLIEGHCDELGTAEYNVALGDRRAKAVRDYLALYGVAPDRLSTVSYGKERPVCAASTSACREENRRAEFRVKSR